MFLVYLLLFNFFLDIISTLAIFLFIYKDIHYVKKKSQNPASSLHNTQKLPICSSSLRIQIAQPQTVPLGSQMGF